MYTTLLKLLAIALHHITLRFIGLHCVQTYMYTYPLRLLGNSRHFVINVWLQRKCKKHCLALEQTLVVYQRSRGRKFQNNTCITNCRSVSLSLFHHLSLSLLFLAFSPLLSPSLFFPILFNFFSLPLSFSFLRQYDSRKRRSFTVTPSQNSALQLSSGDAARWTVLECLLSGFQQKPTGIQNSPTDVLKDHSHVLSLLCIN